jgi:hypothetical protein
MINFLESNMCFDQVLLKRLTTRHGPSILFIFYIHNYGAEPHDPNSDPASVRSLLVLEFLSLVNAFLVMICI